MTKVANGKKSTISADIFGSVLTLTFANGQEVVVDAAQLSEKIRNAAMMHGLKQKLVDAAALSRNTETGLPASVADKFDAVNKIAQRLVKPDGEWNEGRTGGNPLGGGANILIRALMQMTGKDKPYVEDFLSAKTKEERAALRKNPKVLAIISELQAATVSNGVNTDSLLSELGVSDGPGDSDDNDDDEADEVIQPEPPQQKPNTRTSKKKLATASAE